MIRRPWPMMYGGGGGGHPMAQRGGLSSFRPLEPPRLGGFPPPPDWGEYQLAARVNKPRELCFLAPMYRNAMPPPPMAHHVHGGYGAPPPRRLVVVDHPELCPYSPHSQPPTPSRCSCHCMSPSARSVMGVGMGVRSRSLENVHRPAVVDEVEEDEAYFLKHRKPHYGKENYLKRRSMENLVEVENVPLSHQLPYPNRERATIVLTN
ncbi:unnamed protein product [Bemisia tabaci]|uniref:Uncharacterized protein n=1 Tax=Bemisia tabaci TaxID=7038 RepID=A0A9P0F6M1_BEMTA|nr:unnamed protein product [Bemisia tabaci]